MQAPYNEVTIQSLLRKLRIFNRDIGQYELFAITENFDYVVKLSNGKILITIEELQEDEKETLSTEALALIAQRFVPSGQTNMTAPQSAPEEKEAGQPAKNMTMLWTVLVIAGVCLLIAAGLAYVDVVNDNSEPVQAAKIGKKAETYKEQVMTIEEIERSKPVKFLSSKADYKKNIWGTKIKLNCTIKNTATIASYKDVVLRVTYFNDAKTVIGNSDHTLFDNFPSQSEKAVEMKIDNVKHTDSISCKIVSAKVGG